MVEHPIDRSIQLLRPPVTRHAGLRARRSADRPQHVQAMPRRPSPRQVLDHVRRRSPSPAAWCVRAASLIDRPSPVGVIPMAAASLRHRPGRSAHRWRSCGAGCRRRLRVQGGVLQRVGSPALTLAELGHLHLQRASTWAVRFENCSNNSLGTPAISACPLTISPNATPYRCGELGAEHRLVQPTQRPLMALQHPGIQGQPATVDGLHLRRDHQMGVQLRIIQRDWWSAGTQPRSDPGVSGCSRPPLERIRVVDPNRSR